MDKVTITKRTMGYDFPLLWYCSSKRAGQLATFLVFLGAYELQPQGVPEIGKQAAGKIAGTRWVPRITSRYLFAHNPIACRARRLLAAGFEVSGLAATERADNRE